MRQPRPPRRGDGAGQSGSAVRGRHERKPPSRFFRLRRRSIDSKGRFQEEASRTNGQGRLARLALEPHRVAGRATPRATNMPPQTRLKLLPTRSSSGRMRWARNDSRYSTTNSTATKLVAMTMN